MNLAVGIPIRRHGLTQYTRRATFAHLTTHAFLSCGHLAFLYSRAPAYSRKVATGLRSRSAMPFGRGW